MAIVDPGLPGPAVVASARRPAEAGRATSPRTSTRSSSPTRTPTTSAARADARHLRRRGHHPPQLPHLVRPAGGGGPRPRRGERQRARPPSPFGRPMPWRTDEVFRPPLKRRLQDAGSSACALSRFVRTPAPTRRVDDAEVITLGRREWVALHTPGHTNDHLCLFDAADGIVLSGDHVLPTITPHISGLVAGADPLTEFFASPRQGRRPRGRHASRSPPTATRSTTSPAAPTTIRDHHSERLDTLRAAAERARRRHASRSTATSSSSRARGARWPRARPTPTSSTSARPARSPAATSTAPCTTRSVE